MAENIYSISIRLRRTTTETAFVLVPATGAIMIPQPDGTARIDPEKMTAVAVQLGNDPVLKWEVESKSIEPHPIQIAPPHLRNSNE